MADAHYRDHTVVHNPICNLLACRLMRLGRWKDARPYFNEPEQKLVDDYIAAIRRGHDTSLPNRDRASSPFFAAARIMRTEGMTLAGTELGPDSAMTEGGWASRPRPWTNDLLATSPDENRCLTRPAEQLDRRFQYRYTAADSGVAGRPASPENSNELADALNRAGSWLKTRDPIVAATLLRSPRHPLPPHGCGQAGDRLEVFVPVKSD